MVENKAAVYQNLTQTQLDAEYDNRAKVLNSADHLQWYADVSKEYRQTALCELDVAYGNSKMENLDIFFPDGDNEKKQRPVHVFFHGGYWRALSKNEFSYVARGLMKSNAICVVMNYDLIPNINMDQLVQQCRQSLYWVWQNIEQYGGDRNHITLSGHSAGGHLVAMMMSTDWTRLDDSCPINLVKSGVSISGLFDLEPIRLCFLNKSLSLNETSAKNNSPLFYKNESEGELICYYGSLEGKEYRSQSDRLAEQWQNTTSAVLNGHDHFSCMRELYDPNSFLAESIQRQLTKKY